MNVLYIPLVILLIFVIHLQFVNYSLRELFNGFYVADPMYCREAGLAKMFIYFNCGDGYIYIQGLNDNVLLADTFKYKMAQLSWNVSVGKVIYGIQFNDLDYQDFFPVKMNVEYIPKLNRIKLYNKGDMTLHGILFKDGALSDAY